MFGALYGYNGMGMSYRLLILLCCVIFHSGSPDQPRSPQKSPARDAAVQPGPGQRGHNAEPNGMFTSSPLCFTACQHGGQHGGGGRRLSATVRDEVEDGSGCVRGGGDLLSGRRLGVSSPRAAV